MLLFATCKKAVLPPDLIGDPVFTMDGVIDNNPFSVVAGDNNFYLFTRFQQDELGVHEFTGSFEKDEDCINGCAEKLSITIRDFQAVEANRVLINEVLGFNEYKYVAPRSFVDSLVTFYEVAFTNLSTSSTPDAEVYEWDFGNGIISTARTPPVQNYLDTTFFNPVTLKTAVNNTNCEDQITKSLSFGSPTCAAQFEFAGDSLTVFPIGSSAPYNFAWSNGETGQTTVLQDSLISLSVTVTDAIGCVEILDFETTENVNYCSASFDFDVTQQTDSIQITDNDSINFSKVKIAYTTFDGVEYFSELAEQGVESSFILTEVVDYEDNENGESTKQFSTNFTCILSDREGNQIEIQNMSGVIAIAYPN